MLKLWKTARIHKYIFKQSQDWLHGGILPLMFIPQKKSKHLIQNCRNIACNRIWIICQIMYKAFNCGKIILIPAILLAVFVLDFGTSAIASPTPAQATSSLSGTVVDETGAVIADVRITVLNSATGFQRSTVTSENGYFIIPLLAPGNYTLTAEMPGFAVVTINNIILLTSINTALEIALLPKPLKEAVNVDANHSISANSNTIDITTGSVKLSVTNEQILSLPVFTTTLGRNTLGILPFLLPGVSPTSASGTVQADANRRGDQMSINGSRASSISFNFEGGDNNDQEYNRSAAPFPNPDALQEFTIISNSYQADFGRSSGGIINAIVKGGTSRYKGTLRHYLINEALNARSFFDLKKPRDRVNTFGGQLGGPVKFRGFRNTFFFVDYEGARAGREALATLSVLSVAQRQGDFSALALTQQPVDPLTQKPFVGGKIPASRINPIAREYLQRYIPLPNSGENLFNELLLTRFHNDQFTMRFDRKLSEANNLTLTYFLNKSSVQSGTGNLPVGSKTVSDADNQNLILRHTYTPSARMVNQLTIAATRFISTGTTVAPGASGVSPAEIGFTGVRPQSARFLGVPSLIIQNTNVRISTGTGEDSAKTVWQLKDDLARNFGDSTITVGMEMRGFLQNTFVGGNNGNFLFISLINTDTHDAAANFLLGLPSSYSQLSGGSRYPRQITYAFYALDDWRLRANLTLKLGLRYELAPPFEDKLDQLSVFRPGIKSQRFPNAPEGILFVGDPDPILGQVPRGSYLADKNDFAPRIGIAWSPDPSIKLLQSILGKGTTALRAGFGMIYDQPFGYGLSQAALTQPFSITQTLDTSLIQLGGGSFANPFGILANPWPINTSKTLFTTIPALQPYDPAFRTAYSFHYNLTVQRQLSWAMLLQMAYVGSNSLKLNRERQLNIATINQFASPSNLQARRIYPHIGQILSQESTGRARYDSFQVMLTRRAKQGIRFDVSYVYGKSLDDGSNSVTETGTDPLRWARSSFDRRHNFVLSFTYALPHLNATGIARTMLHDWQISGITEWRSGQPLDISQSLDTTLTGQSSGLLGIPDVVAAFRRFDPRRFQTIDQVNGSTRSGNFFFDPTSFQAVRIPGPLRAGNLGRNVFDGPGMALTSVSLIKQIHISDSQKLDLRSDIRNLFNRPHLLLSPLSLRADSTEFGKVFTAAPGRIFQLSLRYSF
jgi:hypothetical protein